jgi:predicted P-loop ATPase
MTKQEAVIKYIEDNYLQFRRLRHDIVSDKLQIRMEADLEGSTTLGASVQRSEAAVQNGSELWREMTKQDINSIVCHCAQECDVNITTREVMTALQSDLIPDVHPLREYILSLKPYTPDQPDWIDFVAKQVHVRESALWRTCFKKWFVAMVASWMHDEVVNHTALVLVGRQGIFKTTWLEHLIPPALRAYSSKMPLNGQISKDDRLRLCENAMLNIDELDAICGREMNIVKSLLTSTDVNERAAYGRLKERSMRLASFCASTNNLEFLTDITGNRRWLPFEVESIQNPFHITLPYERIYAQAKALIEGGTYMYWFDLEDIEQLEKHNEDFRAQENEEQLLPILFDIPAEGKGEFMTTAQISERLVTYGNIKKPMALSRLGIVLGTAGFRAVTRKAGSSRARGWIVYQRDSDEINTLRRLLKDDTSQHDTAIY